MRKFILAGVLAVFLVIGGLSTTNNVANGWDYCAECQSQAMIYGNIAYWDCIDAGNNPTVAQCCRELAILNYYYGNCSFCGWGEIIIEQNSCMN